MNAGKKLILKNDRMLAELCQNSKLILGLHHHDLIFNSLVACRRDHQRVMKIGCRYKGY